MSNIFSDTVSYLTTGTNWTGTEDSEGLLVEIGQHIGYTFYAVAVAALIAVPIGLLIGHTGKGEVAVVGLVNVLRSLPTLVCCCSSSCGWVSDSPPRSSR